MKKFTKIMLIIAVSLLGAGLIFCGVSTAMGASVWRMAKNGDLRYGNWHIGPVGLYYSSADGDDEEDDDMDDFDEYFSHNLKNIGFNGNEEGASDFVDYLEKSFFRGIPVLIKRGPGINLANCLANTIYGVPVAAHLLYSEDAGIQKISEFLADIPDRVVCIDGFIGNCNEMELVPMIEQYRNKIIILTYMYDQTLRFVPRVILSSVHFISADVFSSVLRIRDITEDPSEVKEISSPIL